MRSNFNSKKLVVLVLVIVASICVPILFHTNGISDQVTMEVLGIIGGAGIAYKVIQGKIDLAKVKDGSSRE